MRPEIHVIIPAHNRIRELTLVLQALTRQTFRNFDVALVDDGSSPSLVDLVQRFEGLLQIRFQRIANSGPSFARNLGASLCLSNSLANDILVFLDSDCIPELDYLEVARDLFHSADYDYVGGMEVSSIRSTCFQRAIDFVMTSMLTTGGLRGGFHSLAKFYPRGGNAVIRASLFARLKGFRDDLRFGEDIDLGMRVADVGVKPRFVKALKVAHERRKSSIGFFCQMFRAGESKSKISHFHANSLQLVHMLPILFWIAILWFLSFGYFQGLWILVFYLTLVALYSGMQSRSYRVGFLSAYAVVIQQLAFSFGLIFGYINLFYSTRE